MGHDLAKTISKEKLEKILVPNQKKHSALLKRFDSGYLAFVSDLRRNLEYKKKPLKDRTLKGVFHSDD